jgi:hypothetical protein
MLPSNSANSLAVCSKVIAAAERNLEPLKFAFPAIPPEYFGIALECASPVQGAYAQAQFEKDRGSAFSKLLAWSKILVPSDSFLAQLGA